MLRPLLIAFAFCLSGCGDRPMPAGGPAAPATESLVLRDDQDHACAPLDGSDGRRATVLLFLMHDCPVANATAPQIARLLTDFTPQGIRFFGIYATETATEIRAHRAAWGLSLTGLQDPDCHLARRTGATRVPQAVVLSPSGALLYRGRIDDRAVKPGVTRPEPSRHDLRLALESVLAGNAPDPQFTPAVGCYLPVP